jgi:hypothetical protein
LNGRARSSSLETVISPTTSTWVGQQLAYRAAEKVVRVLEAEGIRCLLVKGVVVAKQLYADPVERPFGDVDLLIRPRDFLRLLRVAKKQGWPRVWDSKTVGAVNVVVDGVPVDVASTVGPPGVSAVSVADFLGRARRAVEPVGFEHEAIEVHDHALLLAIDAFKDKLGASGKPWAKADLRRIAERSEFRADVLVARTREARLQTLVATVAGWLQAGDDNPEWRTIDCSLSVESRVAFACREPRRSRGARASRVRSAWLAIVSRAVSEDVRLRAVALVLAWVGTAAYCARHGRLTADAWRPDPRERDGC